MIIDKIIVDEKNVLAEPLDTSFVGEIFDSVFGDLSGVSKNKTMAKIEEKDKVVVVDRVPSDFVCKGRCDACVYRNVVHSGRTR